MQERALRFVCDDYTSSCIKLLEKALVPSLQIRRIRTMALETYKIVNKLAPVCLHELVNVKNSKYAFRYSNILDVPQVRTTRYGKISFMLAAETLWNDLPTVVKELRSKMLGQHPGYFKAVFLKKTQIIIVSIYEYTVYIMF